MFTLSTSRPTSASIRSSSAPTRGAQARLCQVDDRGSARQFRDIHCRRAARDLAPGPADGDSEELAAIGARLEKADAVALAEVGTTCCYAKSDKFWATDPQGVRWETFRSFGEAPTYYSPAKSPAEDGGETACGGRLLRSGVRVKFAAEFLGTMLLLATVVGSGIMGESLAQGNPAVALLANAAATAGMLYVLITILGPLSGAHFNPAVTLVAFARGELRAGCAGYVLAQVTGAIGGVWLAHFMFDLELLQLSGRVRQRWDRRSVRAWRRSAWC